MTLEQRVAKLERQNRWLRTGGVVLIAGVAFVFLIAQAGERELPDLIANSLTLKDIDGNVRGAFGPGPNGSFALSLRDKSDNLRGCFGLGQDGPAGLDLFDRDGRKRVAVEVLSMQEDVPVLWFIGEDGVVRADSEHRWQSAQDLKRLRQGHKATAQTQISEQLKRSIGGSITWRYVFPGK